MSSDDSTWSGGCRRLSGLLSIAVVSACSDAAAPLTSRTGYDLVFDGEVSVGRPLLFRGVEGQAVLVRDGVEGRRPAARSDGLLAFQSLGNEAAPSALAIVWEGRQAPVALGNAPGGLEAEVSWSPDGRRIAFMSQAEDPAGDIFVARVDGTRLVEVQNLTPRNSSDPFPQPDRTPAWSPDGARIAFTTYRAGGAAIWVMNTDGTGARAVTSPGAYGDFEPSWSPNGDSIAFQRSDAVTVRVGTVASTGGVPRFLAWPAKAYNPAWSPDGRLAFSSDIDGDMDIFVVTPEGVELGRVRRSGTDRNPTWVRR
jgi:dipeptidyl aminopeptidase/acylaminoacyl peptidase